MAKSVMPKQTSGLSDSSEWDGVPDKGKKPGRRFRLADAFCGITSGDVEFTVGVRFARFMEVANDKLGEAFSAGVIEYGHC
jgi:hypothetical protein